MDQLTAAAQVEQVRKSFTAPRAAPNLEGGLNLTGKVALTIIVLVMLEVFISFITAANRSAALKGATSLKQKLTAEAESGNYKVASDSVTSAQAAISKIKEITENQTNYTILLTNLETVILDTVRIDSLTVDNSNKLTIIFKTSSYQELAKQVKVLNASHNFAKLVLGSVERNEGVIRFSMEGKYIKSKKVDTAKPAQAAIDAEITTPSGVEP